MSADTCITPINGSSHVMRNETDYWSSTRLLEPKREDRVYTSVEVCSSERRGKPKHSRARIKRSGAGCGTEKRPQHPCGVRSVTRRRTRSSTCWRDLRESTFAILAWIVVNRSCRKSERSSQFPLADEGCVIVLPYPTVRPSQRAKA